MALGFDAYRRRRRGLREGRRSSVAMHSGPKAEPGSPRELRRYEALLEMADLMVHHRSLPELLHELAQRLPKVLDFQLLNFSLYDPQRNVMDLHLWESEVSSGAVCEESLTDSASGWVW